MAHGVYYNHYCYCYCYHYYYCCYCCCFHLTVVFHGEPRSFSSHSGLCFPPVPLWRLVEQGFLWAIYASCHQPWVSKKHWPQPVALPRPFFINHQTADSRGIAYFTSVVQRQYQISDDVDKMHSMAEAVHCLAKHICTKLLYAFQVWSMTRIMWSSCL